MSVGDQVPYLRLTEGVKGFAILTSNDLTSGMWRLGYEKARGRSSSHALSAQITQTVASMMGRHASNFDDGISVGYGNSTAQPLNNAIANAVMAGAVSSVVGGSLDAMMNRGGRVERWIAPALVASAVSLADPYLYNDKRII